VKHARKALVFLILLVTPLLLAGVISPAIENKVEATISPITTKVNVPSYDVQTPILAYNDFDMDNYASALSWEGDGSPDTPYIIEGYNITSNSDSILIHDTTKAFEIRNCLITSFTSGSGNGIMIDNATQVAIVDTIVMDKSETIDVRHVTSLFMENCTVYDGSSNIYIRNITSTTITECNIYGNFVDGLYLRECNNSMITKNVINGTIMGEGIRLYQSHFATIEDNHIFNCGSSGIYVYLSDNATILNNVIHDNMFFTGPMCGIHVDESDYAIIVGNEVYDNSRNGIFLEYADWAYIADNEIYGNAEHGIDVMFSIEGMILENDIHGNGFWPVMINSLCGIYLGPSYNFSIIGNMIWNNTPAGISLETAGNAEIVGNKIFDNTDTGIYAFGPGEEDVNIRENEVYGNGHEDMALQSNGGILLYSYENCTIEENIVYNNTEHGIAIQGNDNTAIGNEVYNISGPGIEAIMVYDCLISENTVYDCEDGILLYSIGSNATDNIVYDNEVGIHLYGSQSCYIYGNDVGWNDNNSVEEYGMINNMWYNDVTDEGNHWHDYNGGGIYWISNGTHGVTSDDYPSISLNLTQANSVSYEILETGNVIEWDAYALNPSHYEVFVDGSSVMESEWNGGNIEYLADDLAHGTHTIAIEVYHISGHSMENGTTAGVEDLTDPSDITGPTLVELTVGDTLSAQYSSEDPSGIEWTVNNTVDFAISSTGLLTSMTDLAAGEYVVRITVTDPYGHSTALDVTITVTVVDAGLPTELILAIGGGSVIVILIIGGLVYKTKKG